MAFLPDQPSGCIDQTNQALRVNLVAGGGSGGPATIADGADIAQGATTDAAVTADANGTISGKLRGLVKILASVWDSVNGRLKVDGSGVTQPVSGTVTANITSLPLPANAAQETGGNLAALVTNTGDQLGILGDVWDTDNDALRISQANDGQPLTVQVQNLPAVQPIAGSVQVTASPLAPNAAQETGGNLAAIAAGIGQLATPSGPIDDGNLQQQILLELRAIKFAILAMSGNLQPQDFDADQFRDQSIN